MKHSYLGRNCNVPQYSNSVNWTGMFIVTVINYDRLFIIIVGGDADGTFREQ